MVLQQRKKESNFLAVVEPIMYKLLCSMLAPENLSFKCMVRVLSEHQCPKPSETALCFKFYNWNRNVGESVSIFISEKFEIWQDFVILEIFLMPW